MLVFVSLLRYSFTGLLMHKEGNEIMGSQPHKVHSLFEFELLEFTEALN